MGRIAGTYGVRGWVKVVTQPETLAAQRLWWIGGAERVLEQAKPHSGTLLAKLAGIESREQAQALVGKAVCVPRGALPEPPAGTYYWGDLVGLEVTNAQGLVLGVVKRLLSAGAHDVMELAGERSRLLPWVPAVVKKVDLPNRRIEVEWGAEW